jgi:outer membrane lipoprotein-sorting protein
MIKAVAVLALLVCALPGALAQHSPTRSDLPVALRKAIEVGNRLTYVGKRRVEFRKEGKLEAFTELVTRDGNRMRIEFPAGSSYSGQVIVETKGERRHYFPDRNEIQVSPARREEAFDRLTRLGKSTKYSFSVGAEEMIAGIAADHIVVSDRSGNISQRLFIDPHSGMVLKRKLYDDVGTQIGFFEFKSIDLSPRLSHDVFQIVRKGAKVVHPVDLLKRIAGPAGFLTAYVKPTSGYALAF